MLTRMLLLATGRSIWRGEREGYFSGGWFGKGENRFIGGFIAYGSLFVVGFERRGH